MKFIHAIALVSMMGVLVKGLSFSDVSSQLTPTSLSNKRNIDTDMAKDDEERIYGGSDVSVEKYPYVAGLRHGGPHGKGFCGGVLIAPQYVLTSAYCFYSNLKDVYVSLGSPYRSGQGTKMSEQIRVVEIFKHPKFDVDILFDDVGLVKLERPAAHQPAKLPAADGSDTAPGTMATVLGWGKVNEVTYAQTLQSVDVEIISNAKCSQVFADYYNFTSDDKDGDNLVLDSAMCAGRGGGKDVCYGDFGSPLVANNDVVAGIVSWGIFRKCGAVPGYYTRVSKVLPFIKKVLNGGSSGNATHMLGKIHHHELFEYF